MSSDRMKAADLAFANISSDLKPAPPHYPCKFCGRETKEHVPDENGQPTRICAMPRCRKVQPWTYDT